MPELPEVETIKESLKENIIFKKIIDLEVFCSSPIKYPELPEFLKNIKNKKVKSLDRKGKFLIIKLSDNYNLVVHMGMTGQLVYYASQSYFDRHTHLIFNFEDETRMQFSDIRKFGGLWLVRKDWNKFVPGLKELGIDPLQEEFSMENFQKLLEKKKGIIKYFLLNQKNLAGLGNIYADEVLFRAGIKPERLISHISTQEREKLYYAIKNILGEAIKSRGTSVVNYTDGNGNQGSYQNNLMVYKRLGKPCQKCGTLIDRIVLGGRGTYFCPTCQV